MNVGVGAGAASLKQSEVVEEGKREESKGTKGWIKIPDGLRKIHILQALYFPLYLDYMNNVEMSLTTIRYQLKHKKLPRDKSAEFIPDPQNKVVFVAAEYRINELFKQKFIGAYEEYTFNIDTTKLQSEGLLGIEGYDKLYGDGKAEEAIRAQVETMKSFKEENPDLEL
ncbi:MAG: hypothetical protein H0W88_09730 [Parachlamydiaceae bacterium]|nr:hypothetical protein [Parachlamydiaceae bacterium]